MSRITLVVGSPLCMACSTLQNMNEAEWRGNAMAEKQRRMIWAGAVKQVEFCTRIRRSNDYMLFTSTLWQKVMGTTIGAVVVV